MRVAKLERSSVRARAAPVVPARVNRELEILTHITDTVFMIPGVRWRFGLDPLVGFVPWFGDLLTTVISLYVLMSAVRRGVPRITLVRMGLNIVIDLLVGSVPLVGDLFDAWWKTNTRNLALLRRRGNSGPGGMRGSFWDWLFVGFVISIVVAAFILAAAATWWLISQVIAVIVS